MTGPGWTLSVQVSVIEIGGNLMWSDYMYHKTSVISCLIALYILRARITLMHVHQDRTSPVSGPIIQCNAPVVYHADPNPREYSGSITESGSKIWKWSSRAANVPLGAEAIRPPDYCDAHSCLSLSHHIHIKYQHFLLTTPRAVSWLRLDSIRRANHLRQDQLAGDQGEAKA
jgi:hypothetical protein